MKKESIGVAKEGWPFIALMAISALVFAAFECWILGVFFWVLTWFCTYFFRDPERFVPKGENLAVSPADGKVISITTRLDPIRREPCTCISIFMNVFNVHVNRSPLAAKLLEIKYFAGKFFNASLDKASSDNERCAYLLEAEDGSKWVLVQIAGLIARRIVCRAEEGDVLARGERFGLIRFGSRLDLYLAPGYIPDIQVGCKAIAGETVLAVKAKD